MRYLWIVILVGMIFLRLVCRAAEIGGWDPEFGDVPPEPRAAVVGSVISLVLIVFASGCLVHKTRWWLKRRRDNRQPPRLSVLG